ncbi:MAG TPA: nucleoside triphosphate pyrophosphatase [Myxococcota bacterium]|nr:nucleoside triphosphate pyrophosphatase [Myxococcota bacterium]
MLVLASTSPWRISMLKSGGVVAEGVAPPIDEASVLAPEPVALAEARALAKARSVAVLRPADWVIGADQVCWMEGQLFEKPKSPAEHLEHLRALRGRWHTLSTAVALCMPGKERLHLEHTRILLRSDLSDGELAAYVAGGEGAACAGGYQAEAMGAQLIERVEGDWYNVIGLPLFALIGILRSEGWRSPLNASSTGVAEGTGSA